MWRPWTAAGSAGPRLQHAFGARAERACHTRQRPAARISPDSCTHAPAPPSSPPPCPPQDHITPEELAELEAVEDWVQLQAECEEWEHEFLIDIACELAPERVAEVEVAVACASPEAQQ